MWADKTCYFRWRDEMLMVVLRRLVRNRSKSYGQQLLAMFQAAWRMWAEQASVAARLDRDDGVAGGTPVLECEWRCDS